MDEQSRPNLDPPQSSGEKIRDRLLEILDGKVFQYIGIFVLIAIIVDGAFFFFLLVGWQAMCNDPERTDCDPRNWWYNFAVQMLNVLFTWMSAVSMTWRCTNLIHLSGGACPKRSYEDGHDLYGHPTEEIWFHIPRKQRISIMIQLLLNCLTQFANQATRIVYHDFDSQNESPGNIWTNVFFVSSMLFSATGGYCIVREENKLRTAQPDRFPPGPIDVVKEYFNKNKDKPEEDQVDEEHVVNDMEEGNEDGEAKEKRRSSVTGLDRNVLRLYGM
mmetsp:Transcript_4900/g.7431  ORF Transcript_4900/g.7431 Transcript_4900/m.7431 type:complete len:274 (-) Transcript_4900:157-978(-)|eukprot:CAMPEP_0195295642 /NCGR_PEP_ID=MMETSP0707-20130614/17772_1 /TAXON_ID=33640 /ORGANISM="Asterionellopsis glacialis, Strain CCMP134" /LENGTH=273 /DNA_ID=CAMNT_0040356911 /DNA_START=16 /DNA_END=837 /DNA_ORIENTATION=+